MSLGIARVELVELTRPVRIQIWHVGGWLNTGKIAPSSWLHRKRAQRKLTGGCPSSSHPEATQLSLPLYVSGTSKLLFLHQSQRECLGVRKSECKPFKRNIWVSLQPFVSLRGMESLLIFMTGCCGGSFSHHWFSGLGSPVWGCNPLLCRENLCRWGNPPNSHVGVGPAFFASPLFLQVLTWLLLYIFSRSVQLVFTSFSRLIIL